MSDTTDKKYGNLVDEAYKRKERLKALKRKCETVENDKPETSTSASSSNAGEETKPIPKPVFRNYKPQDESLKEIVTDETTTLTDIEHEVKNQLEMLKTPIVIEEIDIENLAPRKPDWDLKRDVAKKLDKLEKYTQRAIAELIRERLKTNQDNILQVVNVGTADTTATIKGGKLVKNADVDVNETDTNNRIE